MPPEPISIQVDIVTILIKPYLSLRHRLTALLQPESKSARIAGRRTPNKPGIASNNS